MYRLAPVFFVLIIAFNLDRNLLDSFWKLPFSNEISFTNPSLEGEPQAGSFPIGWESCNTGATPDILPGAWNVDTKPSDGGSYIGLITRKDGSYESVSQYLKEPLIQGNCYSFSVMLARSDSYENFNYPIRLRVLGGNDCGDHTVLDVTRLISNTDWKKHEISFFVDSDVHFITLEAFYGKGVAIKYRGNILVDNLSLIKICTRA